MYNSWCYISIKHILDIINYEHCNFQLKIFIVLDIFENMTQEMYATCIFKHEKYED